MQCSFKALFPVTTLFFTSEYCWAIESYVFLQCMAELQCTTHCYNLASKSCNFFINRRDNNKFYIDVSRMLVVMIK